MSTPSGSVPGPTGGQMLRHARRMRRDPLGYLREIAAEHGDLVAFPMPRRPALLVNHPDGVRQVLQGNHRGYDRGTVQYRTLASITGGGLLTSDGDRWLRHRRLMQPAFHRSAVEDVVGHASRALDRLVIEWDGVPAGSIVDVDDAMMRTTLEIVGTALFSTDLSGEARRLVGSVLTALDQVVARARNPLAPPAAVPTPGNLRLRRALATLDASVDRIVSERRDAAAAFDRGAATESHDLLGLLLAAHDDVEEPFAARELRDEVVTLIVAGHETVASALTWCWHLVAARPDIQERLHTELDAVLDGRSPTLADVAALPFTRAVIDETLRLYPPAWLISRRAVRDDDLLGHAVPAGSLVFLSPWVLHRHPEFWPNPDRFDPDRFLGADRDITRDRFAYVPFGAGPNLCIGRDLALLEAVLVVARLASRYRFESAPGAVVHAEALVTIRPRDGLPMVLRRR